MLFISPTDPETPSPVGRPGKHESRALGRAQISTGLKRQFIGDFPVDKQNRKHAAVFDLAKSPDSSSYCKAIIDSVCEDREAAAKK